ncbi:hypothetical protein CHUAL_006586 [Chamberlinius hualienensis]
MEVSPQPSTTPTTPGIIDEFLQSGRTGRRNALADEEKVAVETESVVLQQSMAQLSCTEQLDVPGTSDQCQFTSLTGSSTSGATNTQSETSNEQTTS